MILDIKSPPPPYVPRSSSSQRTKTLTSLPPHLLLHIIYLTFPQHSLPDAPKLTRQRKTLYWLQTNLRSVDRTMYVACMHVLRSTHIPAYDRLVRSPYTSDPFPLLAPPPSSSSSSSSSTALSPYASLPPPASDDTASPPTSTVSPLSTIQRETAVLDLYIALKVREDVWADDTELHLEREEAYRDLFDVMQPKARLEDLVRVYGEREGLVRVGSSTSGTANVSNVTLVSTPGHGPPTEDNTDTDSKPRLFPIETPPVPVPVPAQSPSPPPQLGSTPTNSNSSLSLSRPQPRRKPSFNFLSSLFPASSSSSPKSKSKSKSKSPTPPPPSSSSSSHPHPPPPPPPPIQFNNLTITLSPRSASLVLRNRPGMTVVASTERRRDEVLEGVAGRLVGGLKGWVHAHARAR